MTLPFSPDTFKGARAWAKMRWESLPKCACGEPLPDKRHRWTANDWDGLEYCGEQCATRAAEWDAQQDANRVRGGRELELYHVAPIRSRRREVQMGGITNESRTCVCISNNRGCVPCGILGLSARPTESASRDVDRHALDVSCKDVRL